MKFIEERFFRSWKTALVGSAIIIGSIGTVFAGKASLTEAGAFLVTGITLFFWKEK